MFRGRDKGKERERLVRNMGKQKKKRKINGAGNI